jgi:hypothetical protein
MSRKSEDINKQMERLIYESKAVLWTVPTDYERLHLIYLKMNYLLAKIDTDNVAENNEDI